MIYSNDAQVLNHAQISADQLSAWGSELAGQLRRRHEKDDISGILDVRLQLLAHLTLTSVEAAVITRGRSQALRSRY